MDPISQEQFLAKDIALITHLLSRGYRTADTFRMAALFCMGRLDMTPRWRHA